MQRIVWHKPLGDTCFNHTHWERSLEVYRPSYNGNMLPSVAQIFTRVLSLATCCLKRSKENHFHLATCCRYSHSNIKSENLHHTACARNPFVLVTCCRHSFIEILFFRSSKVRVSKVIGTKRSVISLSILLHYSAFLGSNTPENT